MKKNSYNLYLSGSHLRTPDCNAYYLAKTQMSAKTQISANLKKDTQKGRNANNIRCPNNTLTPK